MEPTGKEGTLRSHRPISFGVCVRAYVCVWYACVMCFWGMGV